MIYCTAVLTSFSDSISYITYLFSEWRISFEPPTETPDECGTIAVMGLSCQTERWHRQSERWFYKYISCKKVVFSLVTDFTVGVDVRAHEYFSMFKWCMIKKFSGGQGWWHLQNPLPFTKNFCLSPPPVLRCFWEDPLMTPPPHFKHPSLLPPPHPPPLPPPLKILIIHMPAFWGRLKFKR